MGPWTVSSHGFQRGSRRCTHGASESWVYLGRLSMFSTSGGMCCQAGSSLNRRIKSTTLRSESRRLMSLNAALRHCFSQYRQTSRHVLASSQSSHAYMCAKSSCGSCAASVAASCCSDERGGVVSTLGEPRLCSTLCVSSSLAAGHDQPNS